MSFMQQTLTFKGLQCVVLQSYSELGDSVFIDLLIQYFMRKRQQRITWLSKQVGEF